MIYIIGAFTSFFLGIIALTKKGKNLSDTILGIWLGVIAIHVFLYYTYAEKIGFFFPSFFGAHIPFPFLHGPLLYLYTLALTQPEKFKSFYWLLHLIVPLLIFLWSAPLLISSVEVKQEIINNGGKDYATATFILDMLLPVSGIFYVIVTNDLLIKHKRRILNQFSNQEKINLNWLRFLFYGMAVMWILINVVEKDRWIFTGSVLFIILIGYFGIKQVGVFTNSSSPARNEIETEEALTIEEVAPNEFATGVEKKKYIKSGLTSEMAVEINSKLKDLMLNERLYTNSELTLSDLAARLNIHPNYLSQVINEYESVNFYTYINQLRIDEFKRISLLPENQKYTVLALAYECGFNSKSAFNRFFKKATNLAPSEYMKQVST